jgi:hypothetical protein
VLSRQQRTQVVVPQDLWRCTDRNRVGVLVDQTGQPDAGQVRELADVTGTHLATARDGDAELPGALNHR